MSQTPEPGGPQAAPESFFAAYAALQDMTSTAAAAHHPAATEAGPQVNAALDALVLLRELRGQIAGWEASLIGTARQAGASWDSLARPLGVNSRQAAERRYLRLLPGAAGTTGDQRAQAVRDERAEQRTLDTWARAHAGDLRQLAGRITALAALPSAAQPALDRLRQALTHDDAARLLAPLTDVHVHLPAGTALTREVRTTLQQVDERTAAGKKPH
ncbi:hypothetical protein G3I40_20670 [Streptomyces sp. SID14478]|uniref:hypothetical protein n=1 Tax=Streptomyces sp. SID14478 TaxID=2706073 RepID=UPI0013DD5882|nr:hypothetical protein [Streptomyces sp. SID14478]